MQVASGNIVQVVEKSGMRTTFACSGERSFFGFVVDFGDLTRKLAVEILLDGYPIRVLQADCYVHELARDGVGDGRYGFSFSLHDHILGEHAIIEARVANLGAPVGGPIELQGGTDSLFDPDGPGRVCWLGGLRFSGWIGGSDESATASVMVDGVPVTQLRASGWSHLGSSADDARAVRAFNLHLPDRFADGKPHQVAVIDQTGENFAGSPTIFVAFANGLLELVIKGEASGPEDPRAAILDRLLPMSMPFAQYQEWRQRVHISSGPLVALRAAVIMVGPGKMDDTLESLQEQTHLDWVAASLPETSETTGFQPELARTFLDGDARNRDFTVFGLSGTLLAPLALQRIAAAFCQFPEAYAVFGDLDIPSDDGSVWPLAFPAFDYERMLEQGYCAHLFAMRRETAARSLEAGVSNLYRLFNSMFDEGTISYLNIVHLPGSLGTLPARDLSEASPTLAVASRDHLRRRAIGAHVTPGWGGTLPAARVARHVDHVQTTIIIPTRNRRHLLQSCIESIRPAVNDQNAEVIVVDNDSTDPDTLTYLAEINGRVATVLRVPGPFNFARLNNVAAQTANGEVLCLLNNDTKALGDDWLRDMLSRLVDKDVGAVGALLVWPSSVVQHGGIVLGPGFMATHAFNDRIDGDPGYGELLRVAHECSAVTAACLVTRRGDYTQVGGMDEVRFPVNFNDVDYCLKLRAHGKRVVFTPHAKLVHLESASRGADGKPDSKGRFERELQNLRAKWGTVLGADPYYSPVLSLDPIPFSALAWPARPIEPRLNDPPVPTAVPPGF
jgi:O-antigen biosynthesis protein